MKGFVYLLKCSNGKYYTGSTTNLEKRLWQHQNGEGSNFTKAHLPVELVYVEEFERIDDAFYREKQIQGWSRKKKEALIAKDFDLLHELAKSASTGSATALAGLYSMFTKVNITFHLMFSCENISFVLRTHHCSFALQTHCCSATALAGSLTDV